MVNKSNAVTDDLATRDDFVTLVELLDSGEVVPDALAKRIASTLRKKLEHAIAADDDSIQLYDPD